VPESISLKRVLNFALDERVVMGTSPGENDQADSAGFQADIGANEAAIRNQKESGATTQLTIY
jgi:hypothetical protein